MTRDTETITGLLAVVAETTGVATADIIGHRRPRRFSEARWLVWACLHETTDMSYQEIGDAFERHHTSIIYGVRKADPVQVRAILNRWHNTPAQPQGRDVWNRSARKRSHRARMEAAQGIHTHAPPGETGALRITDEHRRRALELRK